MKLNIVKSLVIMLMVFAPVAAISQSTYKIKSHEIKIEGTSNLQSWSADVEKASGTFRIQLEDGKIVRVDEATVVMDATSIKGSEGRRMDNKIYESLNTKSQPNITFNLRDIVALRENPGTARINANGVITVAGVSKVANLNTVGKVLPNGDIEFTGSQVIRMTDHRVSPPTALLGALKTGDEVTVVYRIVLNAQ